MTDLVFNLYHNELQSNQKIRRKKKLRSFSRKVLSEDLYSISEVVGVDIYLMPLQSMIMGYFPFYYSVEVYLYEWFAWFFMSGFVE